LRAAFTFGKMGHFSKDYLGAKTKKSCYHISIIAGFKIIAQAIILF
jgi:hypothetical protein